MHLEALQGSFLSETNVYLAYTHFGGHLEFCVKMTPKPPNFNIKNRFITLQLVELEVLSRGITKKAYTENDRESSVLVFRHLRATFLEKISFLYIFSISKFNAPGLMMMHNEHLWETDHV